VLHTRRRSSWTDVIRLAIFITFLSSLDIGVRGILTRQLLSSV
jgi:hypothetical protein